jgi:hypothetical protein
MTPGAKRVLEDLRDIEDCDLCAEGIYVYCGDRQTTHKVLRELLWLMAVRVTWNEGRSMYYGINETGEALLRRPELEQELKAAIGASARKKTGPFSIINDHIVFI